MSGAENVDTARAAVITVSTSCAEGTREDTGGPRLRELAGQLGAELAGSEVIRDDRELIAARLRHWVDEEGVGLVLTTGGTGFGPYDLTPEATRDVIERDAPGIAEAMRAASREHTPNWMLSRAVAGIRGSALIVNFPGNPRSIGQVGAALAAALPHALDLLAGRHPH
jgi:molybdenum cofactor synthesis domain-containing protein